MHLKSPRVRGVKVWDMLPATVQKATTKVKFKLLIKKICRTVLNSVGIIYALVVITMVCRKKVSVRIKSLITSAVT